MLKIVKVKIEKALKAFAKKHKLTQKVVGRIRTDIRMDTVLPQLVLNRKSRVQFEMSEPSIYEEEGNPASVCLFIGPRDMQWDSKTGELIGTGFQLG